LPENGDFRHRFQQSTETQDVGMNVAEKKLCRALPLTPCNTCATGP